VVLIHDLGLFSGRPVLWNLIKERRKYKKNYGFPVVLIVVLAGLILSSPVLRTNLPIQSTFTRNLKRFSHFSRTLMDMRFFRQSAKPASVSEVRTARARFIRVARLPVRSL